MISGITYIESFLDDDERLFNFLKDNTSWDERMQARKTASFGVAYNYSQISYPYQEFPFVLSAICKSINIAIGFEPNNCLINYYLDGKSSMGYHSDQTDILFPNTGIAIVSLGEKRTLRFKKISNQKETFDFELPSGSLIYMTQEIQNIWQHSIPKSSTENGRMSRLP